MPTVRCPACLRALSLPEAALGGAARCPLCDRVFEAPRDDGGKGAGDASLTEPSPITDSLPRPIPEALRPAASARELDEDTRRSLASASRWLKAMVVFQLLQAVACVGCWRGGDLLRGGATLAFACPAVFRLFTMPIVYAACHEGLDRRRYPNTVRGAALVALIDSAITLLAVFVASFDILALLEWPEARDRAVYASVPVLVSLCAGGCGVAGALKALALLARPEVFAAFSRPAKDT
jgi:hypothetical protein